MKKALLATLLLGVALAPQRSDAQVQTTITVRSWNVYTNNGGGGWNATSSTPLGVDGLTRFIVYCFDDKRFFTFNKPTEYVALTFAEFLNNAGIDPAKGGRGNNWNSVTGQDLNSMVEQILGYQPGLNTSARAHNTGVQQAIWDMGNNLVQGTSANDFSSDWIVLVDKAEWERGLTGQEGFRGSQSFLAQVPTHTVPEPSSMALLAAGLAGVAMVARRRRR